MLNRFVAVLERVWVEPPDYFISRQLAVMVTSLAYEGT
jgi:hypothetical protein